MSITSSPLHPSHDTSLHTNSGCFSVILFISKVEFHVQTFVDNLSFYNSAFVSFFLPPFDMIICVVEILFNDIFSVFPSLD